MQILQGQKVKDLGHSAVDELDVIKFFHFIIII